MKPASIQNIHCIHCIGIGGVGVSGLAKVLHALGYQVTGEDRVQSKRTAALEALGIEIRLGLEEGYLPKQTDAVIYSSAVRSDHPTLTRANENNIPCMSRGYALSLLMQSKQGIAIAGAHGKTSTVGLVHELLKCLHPTTIIGASLKSIQGHAVLGKGEHLIAEADESDGSLLFLKPVISVLTQIDADHMGHYHHDFTRLVSTYRQFLQSAGRLAILCIDDPESRKLLESGLNVPLLTYGFDPTSDIRVLRVHQQNNQTTMLVERKRFNQLPLKVTVPLFGKHNTYNVLAAIAVALALSVPDHVIQEGLAHYQGVERRLEFLGDVRLNGKKVRFIDDYAHHPREITASIEAIRSNFPERRLVLVFQPHRYSRVRDLAEEFAKALATAADVLILLPIYAASESVIADVNHDRLGEMISDAGGQPVISDIDHFQEVLKERVLDNDVVLFQSAGDLSIAARKLKSAACDSKST